MKNSFAFTGLIDRFRHVFTPFWDEWVDNKIRLIFEQRKNVVDIGGGLRIDASRGNRTDPKRIKKFGHYIDQNYKVTDVTDTYSPDYIEDIHTLSFKDNSIDSIICLAVLEHVEEPQKAAQEIVRVLKHDGVALLYAPYIYRYHAASGEYKDFFRFSKDAWEYLFRGCQIEMCPVRGIFETLLRFIPLHKTPLTSLCRFVDTFFSQSNVQTSGYFVYITKI
ncbi:methyltransferase domain-containing protein [Candidatus Peribacteria bacterium]|nr:methyltransferase domain-containing protein [Candidatus Peribacteria bacterium]